MKRIIAISNHGKMIGGGEHSFLDLVSHFPPSWEILTFVPEEGEVAQRLSEKRKPVRIIALPPLKPWQGPAILRSLGRYLQSCRTMRPHLIYANGSRAAFYGGLAGRLLRVPVLWHCRISDPDPYLDLLLSALSTRIIANSKATANRFSPTPHGKVRVVYNGVDLGWLRQECGRNPEMILEGWQVILVVARASRWKRHDLALSAFEQLAAQNPLVHLVSVGAKDELEPGWWQYLQERSRLSPFSARIHWTGQTDDIRPWYKAASVLLLPSDNEPFGRVLVEAMACGVPVVAMNTGGVPEIVRDGQDGFLVHDSREMVDAILKILQDESLSHRLGRSGAKRAELFSLEGHVTKMVEIFEESLKT